MSFRYQVDTLADLKHALLQYRKASGRDDGKQTLMRETIPFYLNNFEKILQENNGFSVGKQVGTYRISTLERPLHKVF